MLASSNCRWSRSLSRKRGFHEQSKVHARRRLCEEGDAADQGLRRVSQDRKYLGAPAHVPGVRQGWLLRFLQESPCHGALPRSRAPDRTIRRTRRRMAVVLHRQGVSRLSLSLRNRTGAPGSPQRTWAEEDGAKPHHCSCYSPRSGLSRALEGKQLKKVIFVPGTLVRTWGTRRL
jgi:hypothetical protein